ncbi:MAG: hypothetical protein AAFZ15_29795 [Bacteroidota bacterium]
MITNDKSRQRLLAIAAIIIVALLLVNAFLLFNKYNQAQVIEQKQSVIEESDRLKIEMEKQYSEALSELEEMRTASEELNTIIDQQKAQLKQQREKINKLLLQGGNLDRARSEIRNLKAQVSEYITRIQTLKAENEGLKDENRNLSNQAQQLTKTLKNEQTRNEELSTEKKLLEDETNQQSQQIARLSDKVNIASVIKVKNVSVLGMKERDNGKIVKKRYAKNVEQLRICFSLEANDVVNPGMEKFFVRIINPIGETMAIDDLGAGVLVDKSTGDEVRYTSAAEYDYQNTEMEHCFNWNPAVGNFQKGDYQVEIYNKGHLSGTGKFNLK